MTAPIRIARRAAAATAASIAVALLVAACGGGSDPVATDDATSPTAVATAENTPTETAAPDVDLSSLDARPITELFPAADALPGWVQTQAPTEQDLSMFQGDPTAAAADIGLSDQCLATFVALFDTMAQARVAADQTFGATDDSGTGKLELYRFDDAVAATDMRDTLTTFAGDCSADAQKLGSFGVNLVESSVEGAQGFETASDGVSTFRTLVPIGNYAVWTLAPSIEQADALATAHVDALTALAA